MGLISDSIERAFESARCILSEALIQIRKPCVLPASSDAADGTLTERLFPRCNPILLPLFPRFTTG